MILKYEHLVGLPFTHGSRDCYELARDFYRDNFGIELAPIARPDGWWDKGMNLYMDHFWDQGFRPFDGPPREWLPGDGFLMAVRSPVANHSAVYLGGGKILHHFYGRASCVESYGTLWRRATVAVLRHKDVLIQPEETRTLDLMDYLTPQMKAMLQAGEENSPSPESGC